jgi:hypothetical protein
LELLLGFRKIQILNITNMATNQTTPPTGEPTPDISALQKEIAELKEANRKLTVLVPTPQTIGTPTVQTGQMPVRSCRVRLSKDQDVALREITPAEACLLVAMHHKNVGDNPLHEFGTCVKQSAIHYTDPDNPKARPGHKPKFEDGKHVGSEVDLKEYTYVTRTNVDEVSRLVTKYGKKRVSNLFPGAMPTLPSSFDEAVKVGLSAELGDQTLTVHEIKV